MINLNNINYFFDSHAHLQSFSEEDLLTLSSDCFNLDIREIWNMCIDVNDFEKTLLQHDKFSLLKPFLGYSPDFVYDLLDSDFSYFLSNNINYTFSLIDEKIAILESYIKEYKKIFGIGEIGLDYFWIHKKNIKDKEILENFIKIQEKIFLGQLELAIKYYKPVSIHSRGAEQMVLNILSEFSFNNIVILHSFTGESSLFVEAVKKGFFIGMNAIVTYSSGIEVRKSFKNLLSFLGVEKVSSPSDLYKNYVLLETDSPFLPIKKGEFNTPKSIKELFLWAQINL